ncbi:MAG: putative phage abortive infection protein [Pseudomonadales bacterium]|nr:putative phage abortive infection protein [Pseudomonadales bacterium]
MMSKLSFQARCCIVGVIVALIVASYGGALVWITWPIDEYSIAKAANFGGSFGPLATLFSGLAFAGLIITINMQKNDSDSQHQQLIKQQKTISRQLFESTFFQLVSLHNDLLKSIDVRSGNESFAGQEAIETLYGRLTDNSAQWKINTGNRVSFNTAYLKFYKEANIEVGHYLRDLCLLVKFVDQSEVENKKFYTDIIRVQFSSYELALLFYHCLSDEGFDDFKPLIEKYSLLEALPKSLIGNFEAQKEFYDAGAFASGTL